MGIKHTQGRAFIRHPSDIPITVKSDKLPTSELNLTLSNVSIGGLAFFSSTAFLQDSLVEININLVEPHFKVKAIVQWCFERNGSYDVGVRFIDPEDAFKARMVEQVCHIEQYKREVREKEGRKLSGEKAALEWISKYGAQFPNPID